jgi:hypothetical protein
MDNVIFNRFGDLFFNKKQKNMKLFESQINLKVVNNTGLSQPVSILGIIPNNDTANNNNLLYQYDLTGQNFTGITNVDIRTSNVLNPTPIVYSAPVTSQSIIGVVNALNSLNQGVFYYSGNIIYVSSDFYIYEKIDL